MKVRLDKCCSEILPAIFLVYLLDCDLCQIKWIMRPGNHGERALTYFDFWGFKYYLICKIGLKLSTFFDFILSWS